MRPRKNVLVFSARETDMAETLFVLNNQTRIRARAVHTLEAFSEQLVTFMPDAALLFHDGQPSPTAECSTAAHDRGVPHLLVARTSDFPQCQASMLLTKKQSDMANILDGLRIVLARKRGPKPDRSISQDLTLLSGYNAAAANARLA